MVQTWGNHRPRKYSGWWYTYPSEKYEFVRWDDSSQKMESHSKFHGSSHQQPDYEPSLTIINHDKPLLTIINHHYPILNRQPEHHEP